MRRRRAGVLLQVAALAGALSAGTTTRVSVGPSGEDANRNCREPALSPDGRWVAFSSEATNWLPSLPATTEQVYLRDRRNRTTIFVSADDLGRPGNGRSQVADVSANGRFVAFHSEASNLVPGDGNQTWDVFVRDVLARTTERISVNGAGQEGNSGSTDVTLSPDGRFVLFRSEASNLVAGDTNADSDQFLRDRLLGTIERVSLGNGGVQGNGGSYFSRMSADGRFIAFSSGASNLVAGDTNGWTDVFVRDRATGTTTRVSVSSAGVQGNGNSNLPVISADGRFVAFGSGATNLAPFAYTSFQVFRHDRTTGETTLVSVSAQGIAARSSCSDVALSADGQRIVFVTTDPELVPAGRSAPWSDEVYLHDAGTSSLARISVNSGGREGNSTDDEPAINADGSVVAWQSDATNLDPEDRGPRDVFVRDEYPTIRPDSASPRPGTDVALDFVAPASPGLVYLAAASAGFWPGLPLGSDRLPLQPDALFFASLLLPAVFEGFQGTLDSGGRASGRLRLPAEPALIGQAFFVAFAVFDGSGPGPASDASELVVAP
jgi:Tol biopolymer transport system component